MPEATANQQRIALLGVPIEIGASQAGTLMGPAALRTAGIARLLEGVRPRDDRHQLFAIEIAQQRRSDPVHASFAAPPAQQVEPEHATILIQQAASVPPRHRRGRHA